MREAEAAGCAGQASVRNRAEAAGCAGQEAVRKGVEAVERAGQAAVRREAKAAGCAVQAAVRREQLNLLDSVKSGGSICCPWLSYLLKNDSVQDLWVLHR